MSKIIFHIENRGSDYIYHWYIYMLAGLRHIPNNCNRFGNDGGGALEKNYNEEYLKLNKPYNICFSNIDKLNNFQKESLDIISEFYTYVPNNEILDNDIIVNNYGEFIINTPTHVDKEAYIFLKNLFLNKINCVDSVYKNKKYYLSRSKSHLLEGNSGIKRRQIINENDFINYLKLNDIQNIFLEDISTVEKIKLFNQASVIISPNSGGLLFSLFSSKNTKIIELNVETPHQISTQYKDQCDVLNIPYYKFITQKIDPMDNMFVELDKFDLFLNSI